MLGLINYFLFLCLSFFLDMVSQIEVIESSPVSRGYIGSLYILAGAVMFFDSLADVVPSDEGMIAISVITMLMALVGLILSSLNQARATKNKWKLVVVFAFIMTGSFGLLLVFMLILSGTSIMIIFIQIVMLFRFVVALICGIIILTMTRKEDSVCLQLSLPAKLIVGISAILSAVLRCVLYLTITRHLNFIGIILSVVIGCGTILGLVLGIMAEDKRSISVDPSRLGDGADEVNRPLIVH